MKTVVRFVGIALAVWTGVAASALAQDQSKAAAPSAEEKAAMDAVMKAATPGEPHKQLATMAGTFDVKAKMWMQPGAPAQESTGTSENKMIMGGRYLEQNYEGTMMGQPFSGMGITAYDNVTKQYMGSWADTMTTGLMISSGSAGSAPNTIKMTASMADPVSGKKMVVSEKVTITDADHHKLEMWGPGPDGKEFKMMEIAYTRKK
jgi:Protein of unknown function (DUF1579)